MACEGVFPIAWPRVPGHEAVGVIDLVGAGVEGWAVGQRVGVGFLGGDGHHQNLQLLIHVDNPNDRQISVRAIDYQLALAGTHIAEGSSAEPITVPALGQSEFTLNVNADLGTLLKVVGAHLNDPTVEYQVTGTLHLAEGMLREIPFKGHGQVPLR